MHAIALLGTGTMGAAIGRRLLALGHRPTVWNRTPARTRPLVAAGAHPAATPADAVRDADVVITMLTDATAVRDVLRAAGPALRPGTHVVDMSTVVGPRRAGGGLAGDGAAAGDGRRHGSDRPDRAR
ncbi:NAD(P)-binding domain-containing protein, partial [Micromonospora sp. NPDC003776]